MASNTDPYVKVQRTKDIQSYLNTHGYTDDTGNTLAVDGSYGPKTQQALQKFNVHQTHMNTPDPETRDMQSLLKGFGYKNADGTPLMVDGIHGPKTDAAINAFENDFLSEIVPNYTPKTVQKTVFPTVPNLSKVSVSSTGTNMNYTPNAGGTTARQPASFNASSTLFAPTSAKSFNASSTLFAPIAAQPSNSATQASVNSGNTNAANSNSAAVGTTATGNTGIQPTPDPVTVQISDLYKQYTQAKDYTEKLQKRADDYQKQADASAMQLPDVAQKVRAGMATQDEYNALASQVKALRSQADTSRMVSENYKADRDNYKKGMDKLASEQKPAPQVGSGLFDSPEEAATDFANRAMPLTDKTAHEYSAVMTEVMVPEYKDGKMQMVPKYKYGDIVAGELDNVVGNALKGLMTSSEGKKYLLHTHPDNNKYDPDHFSGLPNPFEQLYQKFKDQNFQEYFLSQSILGDASMPTLTGSSWNSPLNILTKLTGIGNGLISGYDGIYLAAPTGKLYLYNGWGNDSTNNQASDFGALRAMQSNPINGVNIPKTRGKWNGDTGEYTY